MCDDLIAKHYLHSATSHTLHPSRVGITHFTLHPSSITWLILHKPVDPVYVDELQPRWNTINSYDPAVVEWAGVNGYKVDALFEMVLATEPTTTAPPPPPGYHPAPALSTKTWYLTTFPALVNTVHIAHTQVFSIKDSSHTLPRRAGWITALPDPATRRTYISSLEVVEAHRRRGLAKWLVGAVSRWWGDGEVWLTVFESNVGAVELYKSLGFREARRLWVVTRA